MGNKQFIIDKGLFSENTINSLPPESFEAIENILKTVKEFRDCAKPNSAGWDEYILDFFHLFGFATDKRDPRLILLKGIGSNNPSKAIAVYIFPDENFEEMVPSLSWTAFLFYAASHFKIEWGILTNGLELKAVNFRRTNYTETFFQANLDEIVSHEKSDSFFTLFKVFSIIRGADIEINQKVLENHHQGGTSGVKIGKLAKDFFTALIESKRATENDFGQLMDLDYCKIYFKLHFPCFKGIQGPQATDEERKDGHGYSRFYADPLAYNGRYYILTSQWGETSRPYFLKWAVEHGFSDLIHEFN